MTIEEFDKNYIRIEDGYEAYRNQPIEADAFKFGEDIKTQLADVMLNILKKKLDK